MPDGPGAIASVLPDEALCDGRSIGRHTDIVVPKMGTTLRARRNESWRSGGRAVEGSQRNSPGKKAKRYLRKARERLDGVKVGVVRRTEAVESTEAAGSVEKACARERPEEQERWKRPGKTCNGPITNDSDQATTTGMLGGAKTVAPCPPAAFRRGYCALAVDKLTDSLGANSRIRSQF